MRLLALPQDILDALSAGKINEGHTRPILMLADRPEEQLVLFKEIMFKKMTVREAEKIARKIAYDRVRKKEYIADPEITEMEDTLQQTLGTRVHIDRKQNGGQIMIDFFSNDDLRMILDLLKSNQEKSPNDMLDKFIASQEIEEPVIANTENINTEILDDNLHLEDDRTPSEIAQTEEDIDLYNIKNFSV